MQLFICWSGERSRSLAKVMAEHLPRLIEGLSPPFVSDQIEKGSLWFEEVRTRLEQATAGLLCLTPENVDSPWIHYEAGALAATLEGDRREPRIYSYLLGVDPRELRGPLSAYQLTVADRVDTKQLVSAIAKTMGAEVERAVEAGYDKWWPGLQAAIEAIPSLPLEGVVPGFEALFRRKTFDEPLVDCTHQRWVDRYTGARDTLRQLTEHRRRVRSACRGYVDDLYSDLCGLVDAYAMDIRAFLIEEKHFDPDDDGRIQIEPRGAAVACERRRQAIKTRVSQLLDERQAPVFEDACRFAMLETFAERKNLIHRTTDQIERATKPLTQDQLSRAAVSDWDFDRIAFYLVAERRPAADVHESLERVRMELEKARAADGSSHMPLHYSLGAVLAGLRDVDATTKRELEQVLADVMKVISQPGRDRGGQMRMTVDEIRSKAGVNG